MDGIPSGVGGSFRWLSTSQMEILVVAADIVIKYPDTASIKQLVGLRSLGSKFYREPE